MNVGKAIEDSAKKYGDKIAIIDEAKEKRLSFKDIDRLTNNLAACLLQKGIKKGDHLAIYMIDSWEYAIAFYAIHKIGAVSFPFSLWAKEGELKNCFKHFLPVAVITSPEYQELFIRMKSDVPSLKNVIIASEALKIDAGRVPPAEINEDDPSNGTYLSYAPDRPRCAMFTYRYLG
ncbi:MAG: class I adenylate-forming enzyme family protein, partial [bacterium]